MKKKVLMIISIISGILLIAGGIFAYFYFRPPTEEEIDRYEGVLLEGDLFLEAHEYSEAVGKYNEAVRIIHTDRRAYSKVVDIYLMKNNFDLAIDVAQKAQNSLSTADSSLIYSAIAKKYYDLRDFYNARINYELSASLDSNPEVNLGLAKSNVANKDIDRATELLSKEFNQNTSDEATLLYAYILGIDDKDKAIELLDNYTMVDTDWAGSFDEYSSVLNSLDDNTLFNSTKLARTYLNNGYPALVIALLEPQIEELEQYVDGLFLLGKAYSDIGDYQSAIDTLSKAIGLIGYEDQKYWMLGRAYYLKHDLVNAITYYDSAIGYSGSNLDKGLVKEYLQILIDSNQATKSQEVYTNIVETITEDWLYLIGVDLYDQAGNDAKVAYYLGKLSQMELEDEEKKEYLFWSIKKSLDNSETDNLDSMFESLLSLDRFNPSYYWLKGRYDLENGDNVSAKNNFEDALEYDFDGNISEEVEKLLAQIK